MLPASGVMQSSGVWAQYAAATPVIRFVTPGPFCAMQTPGRPRARVPLRHVRSRLFVLDSYEADSRRVERSTGSRIADPIMPKTQSTPYAIRASVRASLGVMIGIGYLLDSSVIIGVIIVKAVSKCLASAPLD